LSAQLRLGSGAARLVWPAGEVSCAIVLLGDAPETLCRSLADALGGVVVAAPAQDGATALEWVADHAGELGAGTGRLILAGVGEAAHAVAALASRARDDGWPPIERRLLVDPRRGMVEPG
jgi:acetyl esterase/lipase